MALWLVRAGKYGEFEAHFLNEGVVCLTWENLYDTDLSKIADASGIRAAVEAAHPDEAPRRIANWSSQINAFVLGMKAGDWVVLPRKSQSSIAVGEIVGGYQYNSAAEPTHRHFHKVKWLNREVPRSAFSQDLLYSFGAFLTICEVRRNDAEKRVRAMAKSGWKDRILDLLSHAKSGDGKPSPAEEEMQVDLEQLAGDQITKLIQRIYSGHGLARLVAAILEAQGYTTHISPPGPDKGVDILAAPDPLGFGSPRICVQVKSGDTPVDRPTLDQLVGVMQNVKADQGLLVSWSGFKASVEKETASQFFRVRLWDAESVVEHLLAQYERLPADIRAELPLKRVWAVAAGGEATAEWATPTLRAAG